MTGLLECLRKAIIGVAFAGRRAILPGGTREARKVGRLPEDLCRKGMVMKHFRVWLLILLGTGLLIPASSVADVGPLQMFKGGGVVAPQSPHLSIRLDSQEVTIRLKKQSYMVDVVFWLSNPGETTTEWIGFPKWTASRTPLFPTFMSFRGSVNGSELEFDEKWDGSGSTQPKWAMSSKEFGHLAGKPMKEQRKWLVSRATFPGHARTTVRVTYEAPYFGKMHQQACYIYGTGSLWKDNIKKAVFIIDGTEIGGTEKISAFFETVFGGTRIGGNVRSPARPVLKNVLQYEIRNFKPHPEACLSIKLKQSLYLHKKNYVRPKPVFFVPPGVVVPPMPTKRPRLPVEKRVRELNGNSRIQDPNESGTSAGQRGKGD